MASPSVPPDRSLWAPTSWSAETGCRPRACRASGSCCRTWPASSLGPSTSSSLWSQGAPLGASSLPSRSCSYASRRRSPMTRRTTASYLRGWLLWIWSTGWCWGGGSSVDWTKKPVVILKTPVDEQMALSSSLSSPWSLILRLMSKNMRWCSQNQDLHPHLWHFIWHGALVLSLLGKFIMKYTHLGGKETIKMERRVLRPINHCLKSAAQRRWSQQGWGLRTAACSSPPSRWAGRSPLSRRSSGPHLGQLAMRKRKRLTQSTKKMWAPEKIWLGGEWHLGATSVYMNNIQGGNESIPSKKERARKGAGQFRAL